MEHLNNVGRSHADFLPLLIADEMGVETLPLVLSSKSNEAFSSIDSGLIRCLLVLHVKEEWSISDSFSPDFL
jgi:hypothetical protein